MNYSNKVACFTDIHFGAANNSERHNKDCIKFIDFFCENVKRYKAEAVVFLGDWHEQRNAINALTLNYSYTGAEKLNELGIPIYIIIGNHDAYFKSNLSVYANRVFGALTNVALIDTPSVIENLGPKGSLLSPWLFNDYSVLLSYKHIPIWFLHAEFKNYIIANDTIKMEHGQDVEDFNKVKRIYSGHYHLRQAFGVSKEQLSGKMPIENHKGTNCFYIGNPMGTSFADAGDDNRGMMIYSYDEDRIEFINWSDGPTFVKTSLTALLEDASILKENATVKCLADVEITLEEAANMKDKFMSKYKLRDFKLEEPVTEALQNTDMDLTGLEMESTDNIVCNLLGRIDEPKIKCETLVQIWREL